MHFLKINLSCKTTLNIKNAATESFKVSPLTLTNGKLGILNETAHYYVLDSLT